MSTRLRISVHVTGALLALALAVLLITRTTGAAFTDVTHNPGNAWQAGTVRITDDAATALFDADRLVPGLVVEKCITATYDGTAVPAAVKLYGQVSGDLAAYLDLDVQAGSGGSYGSCGGFVPSGSAFSGTLQSFGQTFTGFGDGFGTWEATIPGEARTYRFVIELRSDNDAQGKSATASFTWEAQNT